MKGIDISSCNWDNGNIDFEAVKNDGVEVVILKSSEGVEFTDPYLEQNYNGAKNAGIPHIGFYHFMSEKTSPSQQAEDFWNAIKDKEYDVKPCLDIETNKQERSANQITDRCLEFINRFKELSNEDVIIYTGGYFGRDELDNRIKCYGGWIANYGVNEPMWTGFNVVGHQYSESGSVNGICGNVDMNNFNDGIFLNKKEEEEDVDNIYNFSETYYADRNPDVVAVYGNSREELLKHYNQYGKNEGRLATPPTPNFNEAYYLINNPDVNANVSNGGYVSGLAHYRIAGWKENRNWNTPNFTLMTTEEIEKRIEEEVEKYKDAIKNKVNEVLG